MKVPKNFKKQFNKSGFFLIKNFYDKTEINKSLKTFKLKETKLKKKSTWTEREPGNKLAVYGIKKNDNYLYKFASSKKLLNHAKILINDDLFVSHAKCNIKQPWSGTVEYFHQDAIYTKSRCNNVKKMVMAMVMMEFHFEENGCLQLFTGSHKLGLLKHDPFININGLSKFTISPEALSKVEKKCKVKKIIAEPGDVLFFHPLIIHGSNHNLSKKGRMIILSQLNALGNELNSVTKNIIKYNTKRAKFEYDNAFTRLKWFEKKYHNQKNSKKIEFIKPTIKKNNN